MNDSFGAFVLLCALFVGFLWAVISMHDEAARCEARGGVLVRGWWAPSCVAAPPR